jgi:ssDNA-binding Zn-finger/Zn-ribbon topoisomerase 1
MARSGSRYGPFWGCRRYPECDGVIGCHPDGSPLGTPANKETRQMRQVAHAAFDNWWPAARMTRGEAYGWLEENGPKAHIADMTFEECVDLVAMLEEDD